MPLVPGPSTPQLPTTAPSNDGSIVLDALPYVEQPDPHYQQQAISLIEAELANSSSELGEHPSLSGRLLPHSSLNKHVNNAPLASAAYDSLLKRQESGQPAQFTEWHHNHHNGRSDNASLKIQYEHHRLHLSNLDLHSTLCTPHHYQRYHSLLENSYVIPQSKLLEAQRLKVDGINASRMEEQQAAYSQMGVLRGKIAGLVEKNGRLDGAVERLEKELETLRGE